jgi:hypothetical protein
VEIAEEFVEVEGCSSVQDNFYESNLQLDAERQEEDNHVGSTIDYDCDWENIVDEMPNMPLKTFRESKDWIQLLVNDANVKDSRYRCKHCFEYASRAGINKNHLSSLATKEGVLHESYKKNQVEISKHASKPGHQQVMTYINTKNTNFFKSLDASKKITAEKNENPEIKITAKVFRTVFLNVRNHGSYNQLADLIRLQQLNFGSSEM